MFCNMLPDMNLESRVRPKNLAAKFASMLKVWIILGDIPVVREIRQTVLEQSVARVVQDSLGLLLEQLQGVEGGGGGGLGLVTGRYNTGSQGGRGL